jgi:hypothetical protein
MPQSDQHATLNSGCIISILASKENAVEIVGFTSRLSPCGLREFRDPVSGMRVGSLMASRSRGHTPRAAPLPPTGNYILKIGHGMAISPQAFNGLSGHLPPIIEIAL